MGSMTQSISAYTFQRSFCPPSCLVRMLTPEEGSMHPLFLLMSPEMSYHPFLWPVGPWAVSHSVKPGTQES